jgi:hypothetical protein
MLLKKQLLKPKLLSLMLKLNTQKLKKYLEQPKLKNLLLYNNIKKHSKHYKLQELNLKMPRLEKMLLIKLLKLPKIP